MVYKHVWLDFLLANRGTEHLMQIELEHEYHVPFLQNVYRVTRPTVQTCICMPRSASSVELECHVDSQDLGAYGPDYNVRVVEYSSCFVTCWKEETDFLSDHTLGCSWMLRLAK
jgi:hypothetical protein